jgi:hypothetical protein
LFAPQGDPSARVEPVSPQEATPLAQTTAPPWQAFAGWQVRPAVQTVVQVPVWQTWFGPQVIPSSAFPTVAQTGEPVAQFTCPILQVSGNVQRTPPTQVVGWGGGGVTVTPLVTRLTAREICCAGFTSTFATTTVE